jgi:hypothetical protein
MTNEPLAEPPLRLAAEWEKRGLPEAAKRVLAVGETVVVRLPSEDAGEEK